MSKSEKLRSGREVYRFKAWFWCGDKVHKLDSAQIQPQQPRSCLKRWLKAMKFGYKSQLDLPTSGFAGVSFSDAKVC